MNIREALHSGRPLLLDAAMGTELARRGADTRPPLWSARAVTAAPELVKAIHAENVAAGADVLTANTFRLHKRNLEKEPRHSLPEGLPASSDVRSQGSATASRRARRALDTGHPRDRFSAIGGRTSGRRVSEPPIPGRRLQQQPPDSSSFFPDGRNDVLARHLVARAVSLAREAALENSSNVKAAVLFDRAVGLTSEGVTPPSKKSGIAIAGSLAPLEDCYRPDLVPDRESLDREHREMAGALAEAGVDLILVETMNTVRELVAAARAALATGLPVVASMVTDGAGRLLSGEPIEEAGRALLSLSPRPDAIGVNCVPARAIGGDLALLRAGAPGMPLSVYANTGRALDEAAGLFTEPIDPEAYARLAAGWLAGGAVALLGSCCGTTAAHTAALRAHV